MAGVPPLAPRIKNMCFVILVLIVSVHLCPSLSISVHLWPLPDTGFPGMSLQKCLNRSNEPLLPLHCCHFTAATSYCTGPTVSPAQIGLQRKKGKGWEGPCEHGLAVAKKAKSYIYVSMWFKTYRKGYIYITSFLIQGIYRCLTFLS